MTDTDSRTFALDVAPFRLRATAYHEAGHAVAAFSLRRAVRHASIVPKDDSYGRVLFSKERRHLADMPGGPRKERRVARAIIINLAGPMAQMIFLKDHPGPHTDCEAGWTGDSESAVLLASVLYGYGETTNLYLGCLIERTRELISDPRQWVQVEALANELVLFATVGGVHARLVCQEALEMLTTEQATRLYRLRRCLVGE